MRSPEPHAPPVFRAEPPARPPGPLFDVHVNLGVTDTTGIGYGRLAADEYRQMMDEAGIRHACVFPPLMADYGQANHALRDWASRQAGRVLAFARLGGADGPRPIRHVWQARRALRQRLSGQRAEVPDLSGFAGIKLIPHLSGLPAPEVFEAINMHRLPVLVHTGSHSPPNWIVERLLPRLETPVIMAHLGAYPTEANLLADAVAHARRIPRLYLDTSGVWVSAFMRYAADRVADKMLFGSDAPLTHPEVAWLQLATAVRDDRQLEAIGWQNAERLFAHAIAREVTHGR